jgi:hypothetical protein
VCFAIEGVGLLLGITMFTNAITFFCATSCLAAAAAAVPLPLDRALTALPSPSSSLPPLGTDSFLHFCGGVLLCWFIRESWHYVTFWYISVFFRSVSTPPYDRADAFASFFPAVLELLAASRVILCKVRTLHDARLHC